MTARSFGELAARAAGFAQERKAQHDSEGDEPYCVRNYSYDVDDVRANRWTRLGNGSWREFNIWKEAILTIGRELREKQRRDRYRGPDRLQGNDLLVLEALLGFMKDPSLAEIYPKKDNIARKAGLSVDTVNESLKRWWNLGFVRWVRRKKKTERQGEPGWQWSQTSNGYYFDLKRLAKDVWHDLWARVHRRLKGAQAALEARAASLAIPIPNGQRPAPAGASSAPSAGRNRLE